jgi:hypothetical protein
MFSLRIWDEKPARHRGWYQVANLIMHDALRRRLRRNKRSYVR